MATLSCHGSDYGTTPSGGSLAQVALSAPSDPVHSGDVFNIDVKGRNLGFSVLHNVRIHLVLAAPLVADSANITSGDGTVAIANGRTVDYLFATIGKTSQSTGTIHASGVLPSGQSSVSASVTAELTSDEVHAGEAFASVTIVIRP